MQRGEVWWADFGERRPVVLLSQAGDSEFRGVQIVDPAGIDLSGFGLEVTVGTAEGLSVQGVVRVALPRPGMTIEPVNGREWESHYTDGRGAFR